MSSPETAQFDGLARHYDWMEAALAGRKLARCREVFLKDLESPKSILLVGEGHGKFLLEVVRNFPEAEVTYLDASGEMLRVAQRRLGQTERVSFVQADVREAALGRHDVVVTHFFLDCFTPEQLAGVVAKLAGCLTPGGTWLLADFQIPEAGWQRRRAQIIHWMMYRFFRGATRLPAAKMTPPAPLLRGNGLVCESRVEFDWGLLHAERWRKG